MKLKSVVWGAAASARSDDTGVLQERSELFSLKLVCTRAFFPRACSHLQRQQEGGRAEQLVP